MICCVSCVRVKNSFVWSFGHLVNGMVGVEANGIISSVIFEVATVSSQARNVIFNHIGDFLASFSLGFLQYLSLDSRSTLLQLYRNVFVFEVQLDLKDHTDLDDLNL